MDIIAFLRDKRGKWKKVYKAKEEALH